MKLQGFVRLNRKRLIFVLIIAVCAVTIYHAVEFAAAQSAAQQVLPVIIIDPGHGGFDPGAVSNDLLEKDINLHISLHLRDYFEAYGYQVVLSREDDTSLETEGESTAQKKRSDLKYRLSLMEQYGDCLFLSIHQNSYSGAEGTQVFYHKGSGESQMLAECIQQSVVQHLQTDSHREAKYSKNEYYVLKNATVPAVLVECGFITSSTEVQRLQDDSYINQLCLCIVNGVQKYLQEKI